MQQIAYVAITILTNNMTTVFEFDIVGHFLALEVLILETPCMNVK